MAQGRPKTVRVNGTGEKLYMALKLSGLSWGARVGPNHISANDRWAQCGLPRSINTVIEDIRSGIPAHRLERYAGFFQVPVHVFVDAAIGAYSAAFSCEVLRHKNRFVGGGALDVCLYDNQARKHITAHNGVAANYPLYQLLSGVHRIYYRPEGRDVIFLGVARTEAQTDEGIAIAGVVVIDGIPLELRGTVFRWNNFVHVHYHSEDFQLLGYMVGPNPMESMLMRRRDPFYLKLRGLSGNLEFSAEPDRFTACAVKQRLAEGQGMSAAFDTLLTRTLREKPLTQEDADYAAVTAYFAGV
ncbi:MAG TPA: hypothetical protein PKD41_05705 [Solidesulfovibrio sp.]|nr:hypothetical protein [Desulfovibrio sp.]HML60364.1 hypothetical protein [Solidesulfovibrio sp.]